MQTVIKWLAGPKPLLITFVLIIFSLVYEIETKWRPLEGRVAELESSLPTRDSVISSLIDRRTEGFSEHKLVRLLKKSNVKYPHIVLAQARIESARYKSRVFRVNVNLFGMKVPGQRATTCKGKRGSYAEYRRWEDSVYDYALWQTQFINKCHSEADYFRRLKSYAKDGVYVSKVRSESSKLKILFN